MKKHLLYGALAFTGVALTACSSDGPEGPNNDVERTFYVNVAVRGNIDGTRAAATDGTPVDPDDFDKGTDEESAVNSAYFVFYDAAGNVIGDVVNVKLDNEVVGGTNTVEKYYKSVVPVSVRQGQDNPTQVICYVNPISPAALNTPLTQVQTVTRKEVKTANGFSMSNSVYYESNGATDPVIATQIQDGQLFETEAEAVAAEGGNVLDIYVERYASKLQFTWKDVQAYETESVMVDGSARTPVTLTFVPERWAVNAEANDEYVVKSYREPSAAGEMLGSNFTYSALDAILNANSSNWTWNAPGYHRSYWACSPAYFTAEYPEVSSDVNNLTLNQHYYTYNELKNGAGYAADNTTAQYFRETTVGSRAIASKNPAAAVPSVILVGKYTVSVNGTALTGATTFYTYMKNANSKALVYFEGNETTGASEVAGGESIINRLNSQVTILFKNVDGVMTPLTNAELLNILTVARPDDGIVLEGNKLQQANVTLQLKSGANVNGIYVANGNGYQPIGDGADHVSATQVNKLLLQNVGYAQKYYAGEAYFSIPVRHYGWYRQANPNKDSNVAMNWGAVNVGDFGMVRNHSYQVNVNKIEGLGAGLSGENNPIVPPADEKNYYIAYRVNILKWAIVPVQNVDL